MKKVLLVASLMLCLMINNALSNNGSKPKKTKSHSKSSVKVNHNKVKKHTLKNASFTGSIKVKTPLTNSAKDGNGGFDEKKSNCKTKRSKQ
jgi:hypothetical protein